MRDECAQRLVSARAERPVRVRPVPRDQAQALRQDTQAARANVRYVPVRDHRPGLTPHADQPGVEAHVLGPEEEPSAGEACAVRDARHDVVQRLRLGQIEQRTELAHHRRRQRMRPGPGPSPGPGSGRERSGLCRSIGVRTSDQTI